MAPVYPHDALKHSLFLPMTRIAKRRAILVALATLFCALFAALYTLWLGVSTSLRAESTLHAYYFVVGLVTKYVEENGKWPNSWESMDQTASAMENVSGWQLPRDITELKSRVKIDFSEGVDDVAKMSPNDFTAIQQIGPHYSVSNDMQPVIDAATRAAK